MNSLRLRTDGLGNAKLESLPLPFAFFGPTATDEDKARAPRPEVVLEYKTARCVRRHDGATEDGPGAEPRHLVFVVSGAVDVAAGDMRAVLEPGDVLLVDDHSSQGHTLTYRGDCRLLHVEVSDAWLPEGVVAPVLDAGQRGVEARPNLKRIFVDDDEAARFSDFEDLFPSTQTATPRVPVHALSFICLSPDSLSDWHTETSISLVVVLTGGFELEVGGGGGAVEVFRAGDVCLAQDQHGQGHITRTHGETRFAAIVLQENQSWT